MQATGNRPAGQRAYRPLRMDTSGLDQDKYIITSRYRKRAEIQESYEEGGSARAWKERQYFGQVHPVNSGFRHAPVAESL